MDRTDLLDDPKFTKLIDRAKHGDEINGIVAEWTATLDARDIETRCVAHDVPVATAYSAADIFADPHFEARGDLVTVDDPVAGPLKQQAPFPRVAGEPPVVPSGAPRLGEHTDAVLAEAGYSAAEIAALHEQGVV
jgi:crotonobetainyl-CoA:carnitine CoA-transferase CaiB-like acyl-CoA transferase